MPTDTAWTCRIWREFEVENLTRAHRDVLLHLRKYRGRGGIAWPAHATLADRAGCCVRTVQRALHQARALGLLDWRERRRRAGWRWLRSSNEYRFTVPDGPVQPGLRPRLHVPATTGQKVGGAEKEESKSRKAALAELLREGAKGPNLLLARQAAFAGRFAADRTARLLMRGAAPMPGS